MLRRQFAEKANQVGPWTERQMDAVTSIGMGLQVWNVVHKILMKFLKNIEKNLMKFQKKSLAQEVRQKRDISELEV